MPDLTHAQTKYIPNFRIDQGCQRRPVRRGHSSFVGLFPSTKSVETVQYESTLERDALILFEADPEVMAIDFQPMAISWHDGERMRSHVPDFLSERNGNAEVVEVKPRVKLLKPAVSMRTRLLVRNFGLLGIRYVVLTEDDIRADPRFVDARVMMNGIGQHPGKDGALAVLALLTASAEPLSIDAVIAALGRPPAFVNAVYALMIAGLIERADPGTGLDRRALVRPRSRVAADMGGRHAV